MRVLNDKNPLPGGISEAILSSSDHDDQTTDEKSTNSINLTTSQLNGYISAGIAEEPVLRLNWFFVYSPSRWGVSPDLLGE
jgi:hypothetical protein